MEIDQHQIWLLGAIKACLTENEVDEKKLNKNVRDCMERVKNACVTDNKEHTLEDFKLKTTLVLLLCVPCIRDIPMVQSSRDFQSILLTFPTFTESCFFSVVRSQKLYKCLSPLLSYLPLSTLCKLIHSYFTCTTEVTPVTLAITLELVKALCFSIRTATENDMEKGVFDTFKLVLTFFSLKQVDGGSNNNIKSSAYYFMYLCECTYLVMCNSLGKYSKMQNFCNTSELWTKLWKIDANLSSDKKSLISPDTLKSFLDICQENVKSISVDIWMAWSEAVLPASVVVHRKSVASEIKPQQNTVQSVICNIAFDLLRNSESSSVMGDDLCGHNDLTVFFKQVSSDPDYDPDQDLERDQLLSAIGSKDGRHAKLLGILLRKEDLFISRASIECLISHREGIDNVARLEVLLRLIRHIKDGKEYDDQSIEMVIKMAEDLPVSQLLPVIEGHLSSGLDEMLKTPDFPLQMTAVFNQLANGGSTMNSSKHVWLCLQSGQTVVNEAVRLPIALPGLVNVMVQALSVIPQVCQAPGNSGFSVLINSLQERQLTGLEGRQERDFSELVKGLIKAEILNVKEVMILLVQPFLKFSSQEDLPRLLLPIELLKSVIQQDVQVVITPGVELVSLIFTLAHVVDATALFDSENVSVKLRLRAEALQLLRMLANVMISDLETYERDISMIKQMIGKFELHLRSYLPLSELLDCRNKMSSHIDCLLHLISQLLFQEWEGKPLKIGDIILPESLSNVSREKWIIILLQLLPHCSEDEWIIAFFVTHRYLNSGRMALHTMMMFQKVLYLALMQLKCYPDDVNDLAEDQTLSSISVNHCFKCFSNASMAYLRELMRGLPSKKQFMSLCSIFSWWCQMCSMYPKELEVPSLFLLQLVTAMEELLNSKKLVLSEDNVDIQGKVQCNGIKKNKKISKKQKDNAEMNGKINDSEKSSDSTGINHDDVIDQMSDLHIDGKSTDNNSKTDKNDIKKSSGNNEDAVSTNHQSKAVSNSDKNNTLPQNVIMRRDFKEQIELLSVTFLKLIPASSLSSSVASKLKKLHEDSILW